MILASLAVLFVVTPADAQFESRSLVTTNTGPNGAAVADFNRDGKMDIAVSSPYSPYEVQVFLGKGDGTFGPPTGYNTGLTEGPLAAADLRGDGNSDLVVINGCPDDNCPGSVSVLLGNGDGTFQAPVSYSTPPEPVALLLGDFNNDGKLDIAMIESSEACACLSVLLGNGDGTFQEPAIITELPGGPEALAAGQFTSGKNLDIAVTLQHISSSSVQILLGNGDGTFTLGTNYGGLGDSSQSIVAGYFSNNGKIDLAIGELQGRGIDVLRGNGDGTFADPVIYPVAAPNGIAAADLNGDGNLDFISGTVDLLGGSGVAVLLGNGDGTFQPATVYPAGLFPWAVAVADFNGDGMPDITMVDEGQYHEYVFLNTGTVSFSPTTPLSFPRQLVGTTSAPGSVTLTNNGKSPLAISSITLTSNSFHMQTTCGASVPAGGGCSISATFSPQAQGNSDGAINIKNSASSKPMAIDLIGSGTVVDLSSTALTFPSQKVGTTSAPQYVEVKNTGSTTLVFKGPGFYPVYVGGPGYNDFSEKNNCGPQNATLAPGATCMIEVKFVPKKTGTRSAVVYVEDTGGGTPQIVLLTGTGD